LHWPTSFGAMDQGIVPASATGCPSATWQPWQPWSRAVRRLLVALAPRVRSARSWRTAIIPARTGMAPSVRMTQPPVGWNGSGHSSCLSRTFWSPLRCLRTGGLLPARTSSACPPCSCRPLRLPCRHWLWILAPSHERPPSDAACSLQARTRRGSSRRQNLAQVSGNTIKKP